MGRTISDNNILNMANLPLSRGFNVPFAFVQVIESYEVLCMIKLCNFPSLSYD
jgi:hypothetical protein